MLMTRPMLTGKRVLLALGALVTLTLSYANGFATLPSDMTKRCTLERYQKMVGYNCADLKLKEIPQNLKSSLQILDVSFNRIRDLSTQSFARYTDVKYLYLFENMIQNIEEGTFSELVNLEAVDLSNNALTTIPFELFRLPMLRNLYVAYNNLANLEEDLLLLEKPIRAPLQILSLAACWLKRLPNFGILPDLWQLNISSNAMTELTIDQFSPMCNLRSLDMNATRMSVCSCQLIVAELSTRKTVIYNLHPNCFGESTSCQPDSSSVPPPTKTDEYQQCMDVRNSRQEDIKAKSAWFKISLAAVACIVLCLITLCYFHRRNARKMKEHRKQHNTAKKLAPINRVMVPSSEDDVPKIVENGNRDKLINDCD